MKSDLVERLTHDCQNVIALRAMADVYQNHEEAADEIERLRAAIDRVRTLHVWEHKPSNGPPFCRTCSDHAQAWEIWPCPTIAALGDING